MNSLLLSKALRAWAGRGLERGTNLGKALMPATDPSRTSAGPLLRE